MTEFQWFLGLSKGRRQRIERAIKVLVAAGIPFHEACHMLYTASPEYTAQQYPKLTGSGALR